MASLIYDTNKSIKICHAPPHLKLTIISIIDHNLKLTIISIIDHNLKLIFELGHDKI